VLNKIILIGNATRDPELKYTPQGLPVAKFGLAVNRRFKNAQGERDVDFFDIVVWRQTAEFVSQYLTKGKKVCVEGRLEVRKYVGNDGVQRTAVEVVADNVELLDSARDASGASAGGPPSGGGGGGQQPNFSPSAGGDADDFADPFSE
jgi:single-strand DNA-binding protein